MLNQTCIAGRFTADPELRRTSNGVSVATFSIACERDYKNKNGERETDFVDVVAYRNTAEFVSKYFAKGHKAIVAGRLQVRSWTDKDGGKRKSTEVVADNVYFCESKRDNSGGYPSPAPDGFAPVEEDDPDLPY